MASRQALASVFSVQNWVLAADAVDYLAAEHQPTALQHFWSLGVEEQFYLFWPLLVAGAAALAAGRTVPSGPGPGRRSRSGRGTVSRPSPGRCSAWWWWRRWAGAST